MSEPSDPISVMATSIASLGEGKGAVSVRIKNPYGEADFEMRIEVESVADPSAGLEQARIKIYKFAKALMERTGDKGSLTFG